MTPAIGSVTLPSGLRLPYAGQGDPAGIPVVLLHGLTDSWLSFEPVLPQLPPAIRAIALTQRGHGDADRPLGGYGPQRMAADVAEAMDALGLDAALICGHSMGSSVAARFAIDHPHRTLGLVLMGARASWAGDPGLEAWWASTVSHMTDPVDPRIAQEFQESTLARPIPPSFLEAVVQESLKLPARVWQAALREAILDPDFSAELGRIRAPALLVCGDRDDMAWDGQAALAAAIPGARRLTYAGAGHALHWEEPARFAADLAAFAEALAAPRARRRAG